MSPPVDGNRLARYRSLAVMGGLIVVVLAVALLAGRHRGAPASGSVQVRFGPLVNPPAGKLTATNGWVASSGKEMAAVYAGSQEHHPGNGALLIVVHVPGQRRQDTARVIDGTGTLTLLRPGHFNTIQAAAQATLHFVTASGSTGTFDLSTDKLALSQ